MKYTVYFSQLLIIIFSIILTNCKGKDGEPGPKGPQGSNTKLFEKEGYMRSEVSGFFSDGTTFKWNLDFQGLGACDLENESDRQRIFMVRYYAGDGDSFNYGTYIFLSFYINNLDNLSNPINCQLGFYGSKAISSDKKFGNAYISIPDFDGSGKTTITDLTYNKTTKVLSGKFTAALPAGKYNGAYNYTNGSFSTIVNHIVK